MRGLASVKTSPTLARLARITDFGAPPSRDCWAWPCQGRHGWPGPGSGVAPPSREQPYLTDPLSAERQMVICTVGQGATNWAPRTPPVCRAAPLFHSSFMASSSVIAITASIAARAYYEGTFIALPLLCPYWKDGPSVTYIPQYITNTAVQKSTVCTTESATGSVIQS